MQFTELLAFLCTPAILSHSLATSVSAVPYRTSSLALKTSMPVIGGTERFPEKLTGT